MSGFVRVYGGNGHLPAEVPIQGGDGALADLVLPDGRTLVVRLGANGDILVRAYGADPDVTQHRPALELLGNVPLVQDLVMGDKAATIRRVEVKPLVAAHLPNEDDRGRLMSERARDTVRALRTMLALRPKS